MALSMTMIILALITLCYDNKPYVSLPGSTLSRPDLLILYILEEKNPQDSEEKKSIIKNGSYDGYQK